MQTYTLKYFDDAVGLEKRIEFKAAHAGGALVVAKNEAPDRHAELWEDGRRICILYRREDVWQIHP